jgi:hypothetical protein
MRETFSWFHSTGSNYVATIKASGSRQFRRRSNFLEQVKMKNMLITAMMITISTPALSQARYVPQTCAYGYYLNAENVCVHKPTAVPHEGATALCRDGLCHLISRTVEPSAIVAESAEHPNPLR